MKVPTCFMQYGTRVKILGPDEDNPDADGTWSATENAIRIAKGLSPDRRLHVFCHEFFHCALEFAGRDDLSADEQFVDTMAGLMAQMIRTAK